MTRRVDIYGVSVDAVTMEQAVERCIELIHLGEFAQQTSLNAGKVVMMQQDGALRDAICASALVCADGQAVVWGSRLLGSPVPERVAGIDLMERLLAECESREFPVYFLGAHLDVLQAFTEVCRRRFPALLVAGTHDGYFADDLAVARLISQSGARVLFVAMPSPRKELYLSSNSPELPGVLAVGVGGSFDVWAGVTRRAPSWMQTAGLEWFYRLSQEPVKLWRRYLLGNVRFVLVTIQEWVHSDSR